MNKEEKEKLKKEIIEEVYKLIITTKMMDFIAEYPGREGTKKLINKYLKVMFENKTK